jgi:hypothetical protein
MNVVAAMPLGSGDILLALYDAGKLDLVAGKVEIVKGKDHEGRTTITVENGRNREEHSYRMFVDCSGQKAVELDDYPFQTLVDTGLVRSARARFSNPKTGPECIPAEKKQMIFQDGADLFYPIGGVDVDGAYRLVGAEGDMHPRLYDIAFPHTSGVRPYSYGLQSCSDTGAILVKTFVEEFKTGIPVDGVTATMTGIYEETESR